MKGMIILLSAILILFVSAGSTYGLQAPVIERDIIYCNHLGASLAMDIYHPETNETRVPAILYIHGGGWYSGDKTTGTGQVEIPALLNRGFMVAAINYRLAPRYEFPAQIEDAKCAVRFLRDNAVRLGLDSEHIGVMGESAGGHLAALMGVTNDGCEFTCNCDCSDQSTRVQAVVDMFGPSDLTRTFERDQSFLIEHVFGTCDPDSLVIKNASPVTHVSSSAAPFLIIHGEKDDLVLLNQSEDLYTKLTAHGVPASLIAVSNAGHGFAPVDGKISPSREEITRLVGDFFERYLR